MQSFELTFFNRQPITQKLLQTIRLIGEYKGKQELYQQQSPQVLETLRQTAIAPSAIERLRQAYREKKKSGIIGINLIKTVRNCNISLG